MDVDDCLDVWSFSTRSFHHDEIVPFGKKDNQVLRASKWIPLKTVLKAFRSFRDGCRTYRYRHASLLLHSRNGVPQWLDSLQVRPEIDVLRRPLRAVSQSRGGSADNDDGHRLVELVINLEQEALQLLRMISEQDA